MKQSIASVVRSYLKSQVEIQGGNTWILNMGYAECNDYAETVRQLLSAKTGYYLRFETVARYVRQFKALESAKTETNVNTNQGVS